MKLLSVLVVGLLVTACSSQGQRPPGSPVTDIPEDGNWFCQMKPSGESWECVQDSQLAEHPRPTRLPEPAPPETPETLPPEPSLLPETELPRGEQRRARPPAEAEAPPEPPPPDGPSLPDQAAGPVPAAQAVATPANDDLPEYARLAYHPSEPVPLTELPADFYAVQLIAMSSKDTLEAFVKQQGIRSMSAARVESRGQLFYVLLLGIYETRAIAERAVAAMPEVAGVQPWIRRLGSLQSAMLRADDIAGSSRY